ncbi:MAG: FAD:protein FMN transferase [Ilumatobacter sp.]|uniref:FAD:protein FMN transferase n=1 Tax=Ilumatobacter sp. TaxID=1967498 RepID=UPI00329866FF
MAVTEIRLRAMASDVLVLLVEPTPDAVASIADRLATLEQRWSRFVDTSDISRLNRCGGAWTEVGTDTTRLLRVMQAAHEITAGAYDPTFLHLLLTAGYSTSIDDADRISVVVDRRDASLSIHDLQIDSVRHRVRAPAGLSVDPGGIGKGFAADLVVTELIGRGTAGALVSIGGDIAAAGTPPSGDGWIVHVDDPHDPGTHLTSLSVSGGGIATSSTRSRRWTTGGQERHHVIDPITGDLSDTDLAAVTVIAPSGWLAEAHATAAIVAGSSGAIDHLERHHLSGVVVDAAGAWTTTPDLADDLAAACTDVRPDERVAS